MSWLKRCVTTWCTLGQHCLHISHLCACVFFVRHWYGSCIRSALLFSKGTSLYETDSVRMTYHWGAFANHCCRGKAINITYLCVRARAPGAWVCARTCVHVALLIYHATRMGHVVTLFVAPSGSTILFRQYIIKGTTFEKKKVTEHKNVCFDFICNVCLKYFSF